MSWPLKKHKIQSQYDDQGFVIAEQFLTADHVAEVSNNLNRYIADVVPTLSPMDVFFEDKSARNQIRMLPRMCENDDYFHALLHEGPLHEIANSLCDGEAIPKDTAYFNKLAEIGEATPPHQDGYYFHLDPCKALTLWLALDVVDEENACVRYIPGSHRQGLRQHGRTQVLGFSQGIMDYGQEERAAEFPACVKPGDLIVHDALTIHRTDANLSCRSRRALGFVYHSSLAQVDESAREEYQATLARELAAEGKI
jgi:phytanoyl-CoA hydroxylase